MKIVSVCRVYPTQRSGGMPFVCQDRAEQLALEGHDVHVLTTSNGPDAGTVQQLNGVSIHAQHGPPQAYSDEFAEGCRAACKRMAPDVIHLDSFDRSRVWWKDKPGNPKVVAVTMHGTQVGTDLTKWNMFREDLPYKSDHVMFGDWATEQRGLKNADRVIAISLNEAWQLRDVLGLPQTWLVYNPIPAYFFDESTLPPPVKPDSPFLCAAISGHKERGFATAQAVANASGRELRVVKDVPRTEMPKVYAECAGVLLPTHYAQGYDLVCAEAAACGRVVYASPTGSYLRETDSDSLWVADSGSFEDFVKAIKQHPPQSRPGAMYEEFCHRHRPEVHTRNWLEAIGL